LKFAAKQKCDERCKAVQDAELLFKSLAARYGVKNQAFMFQEWKSIMLEAAEEEQELEEHVAKNQHVMDKLKSMIGFYTVAARQAMDRWKSYHVSRRQVMSSILLKYLEIS